MLRCSADVLLYDSELQTEGVIMLKACADTPSTVLRVTFCQVIVIGVLVDSHE